MLFTPKRSKFRKAHKGRLSYKPLPSPRLVFGYWGLQTLTPYRLSSVHLLAVRSCLQRIIKKQGRIWWRVFPNIPVSAKPAEVRMGKGKGSVHHWIARLRPGHIIFEIDCPPHLAKLALRAASYKLPVPVRILHVSPS